MPAASPALTKLVDGLDRDASVPLAAAVLLADSGAAAAAGSNQTGYQDALRRPVRIGSITKSLTAAVALLLHYRGDFDVDAACSQVLGEASRALAGVTWRHVLHHTAGLPAEPSPAHWSPRRVPTRTDLLHAATRLVRLPGPPGAWHYSNLGYGLLGVALERATGRSYSRLVEEHLLAPLHMRATVLQRARASQPGLAGALDRSAASPDAAGPAADSAGGVDGADGADGADLGACAPAGQYWSTLADLLTWGSALSGLRRDVLPAEVLAAMTAPAALPDQPPGAVAGAGLLILPGSAGRPLLCWGVMPGHRAALLVDPARGAVAAWAGAAAADALPLDAFVGGALEALHSGDEEGGPLAGRWWLDGQPVDLHHQGPALTATYAGGGSSYPLFRARRVGEHSYALDDLERREHREHWKRPEPIALVGDLDAGLLRWGAHALARDPARSAAPGPTALPGDRLSEEIGR